MRCTRFEFTHAVSVAACVLLLLFGAPASAQDDGPGLVKEIGASDVVDLDGIAFFLGSDAIHGRELWRSDGTEAGTYLVRDIHPGIEGFPFFVMSLTAEAWSGSIYFRFRSKYGWVLWKSDGSEAGTQLVKQVGGLTGPGPSITGLSLLTAAEDGVYFFATDPSTHERALWKSDGTANGTAPVRAVAHPDPSAQLSELVAAGDTLFFSFYSDAEQSELWRSDGTESGTYPIKSTPDGLHQYLSVIEAAGDTLYFQISGAPDSGTLPHSTRLWKSDGTEAGTQFVATLDAANPNRRVTSTAVVGGRLCLTLADLDTWQFDIWSTDGTEAGTDLLVTLPSSAQSASLYALDDLLLFQTGQTAPGANTNLWRSDLTPAGTAPVVVPSESQLAFSKISPVGTHAYLLAYTFDPDRLTELWRTDGSSDGTESVAIGFPGPNRGIHSNGTAGKLVYLRVVEWGAGGTTALWVYPPVYDLDGDGLLDEWEVNGYTHDNGTYVDLPSMGADPRHKDVFVEIDYMAGFQPGSAALQDVVDAFASAPVDNPDGSPGITMHVLVDEEIAHVSPLGSLDDGQYVWTRPDGSAVTHFDDLKADHFAEELGWAVRYCIWADSIPGEFSGMARGIEASDFLVSLGPFIERAGGVVDPRWESGTFMHELGHTLGLRHGGDDEVAHKPNYLSVMNPSFQLEGLVISGAAGNFHYSSIQLLELDESGLDERIGLQGPVALDSYGTTWWMEGLPPSLAQQWVHAVNEPINWWNESALGQPNVFEPLADPLDINDSDNGLIEKLTGFDDWAHLDFTGGTVGGGVQLPPETPAEEQTLEEVQSFLLAEQVTGLKGHDPNKMYTLTWNPIKPQSQMTEYRVYRDGTQIAATTNTNYKDQDITPGDSRVYWITWVNLLGQESVPGNKVTISGS